MTTRVTLRDVYQELKEVDKKRHADNDKNHGLILKFFDKQGELDKRLAIMESNQGTLVKTVDNNTLALLALSKSTQRMQLIVAIGVTIICTISFLNGHMNIGQLLGLL